MSNITNYDYTNDVLSILKERKRATLPLFHDSITRLKRDEKGEEKLQACLDTLVSSGKIFDYTGKSGVKFYLIKPIRGINDSNIDSDVNDNDNSSDGEELAKSENATTPPQQIKKSKYIIDSEFQGMFSEKTKEQYEELKEAIRTEGLRDPLVVWDERRILLDGHNRDRICEELGIEPPICRISLLDREQARIWIIQNQFNRRNLNMFQRVEVALNLKAHYKRVAKENQRAAGGAVPMKSRKPVETDEEVAKLAQTSADTVRKVEKIIVKASGDELNALRNDEDGISINSVYQKYYGKEKPAPTPPASTKESDSEPFDFPNDTQKAKPNTRTPQETAVVMTLLEHAATIPLAMEETIKPSSPDLEYEMNTVLFDIRYKVVHWREKSDRAYIFQRLREGLAKMEAEGDKIAIQK